MLMSTAKKINTSQWDSVGACLNLIGFMLMLLCLISNARPNLTSLYFLKIDTNAASQQSVTFGLFHYCMRDTQVVQCRKETFTVPFDVQIQGLLNASISSSSSAATVDQAAPHDPHMLIALIFCLLCSGISLVLSLHKLTSKVYYDAYFTRGFLSFGASLWCLLLVTLTSITFQAAAEQLSQELQISIGPGIPMVGCAFMVFFLAGSVLLLGCATVVPSTNKANMYC